jgi:DNA-binding transcriptional regulator of glucitol operon
MRKTTKDNDTVVMIIVLIIITALAILASWLGSREYNEQVLRVTTFEGRTK